MAVHQLAPGLWRWTVALTPSGSERGAPEEESARAGCIYYEPRPEDGETIVLVDPLEPAPGTADAKRFRAALDRDIERTGWPLAILLTGSGHARSAAALHARYRAPCGARVHLLRDEAHASSLPDVVPFDDEGWLPGRVRAYRIEGLGRPEVAFFLVPHRALVVGHALRGAAAGRLRLAASAADPSRLRASRGRLLALEPLIVLTAHGEPVLTEGGGALTAALDDEARGGSSR